MKVWFITGCSTGFGRELAKVAAAKGDFVYGTVRQEAQMEALEALAPGQIKALLLDVTHPATIKAGVQTALDTHGQIDVLVNNAGYGSLGPLEVVEEEEMFRQFDVNVFGPVRLIQAVLPGMRARRSGHILNITSIAGLNGFPGVGIYNGSKFALEGIGESLSHEVRPLGIHVTNVEPGPFRTDWAGRSATYTRTQIADYETTAIRNMESIASVSGKQIGDPVRAAEAMYALTELDKPPVHLPLGGPAYMRARIKFGDILQEIDDFEYLGLPTDYPEA
ncbi:MAG: SDR family NAD(P)-dependent oxidoreductase [Bacteroidetes bacterium]|nr:MAG: SDR family NAD(P)-dependent oxidoreductase [Bacteroidota bacterium]